MRLTWKDVVATLFMGVIVAGYVAFLDGTSLWLISSARGTTTMVLVLGFIGGCSLGALGSMYTVTQSRPARLFRAVASPVGVVALVAGVIGLITGSTAALAVLAGVTVGLWVIATIRRAFTAPAGPARTRDTIEVIQHEKTASR